LDGHELGWSRTRLETGAPGINHFGTRKPLWVMTQVTEKYRLIFELRDNAVDYLDKLL
jgi:hypothetical protein